MKEETIHIRWLQQALRNETPQQSGAIPQRGLEPTHAPTLVAKGPTSALDPELAAQVKEALSRWKEIPEAKEAGVLPESQPSTQSTPVAAQSPASTIHQAPRSDAEVVARLFRLSKAARVTDPSYFRMLSTLVSSVIADLSGPIAAPLAADLMPTPTTPEGRTGGVKSTPPSAEAKRRMALIDILHSASRLGFLEEMVLKKLLRLIFLSPASQPLPNSPQPPTVSLGAVGIPAKHLCRLLQSLASFDIRDTKYVGDTLRALLEAMNDRTIHVPEALFALEGLRFFYEFGKVRGVSFIVPSNPHEDRKKMRSIARRMCLIVERRSVNARPLQRAQCLHRAWRHATAMHQRIESLDLALREAAIRTGGLLEQTEEGRKHEFNEADADPVVNPYVLDYIKAEALKRAAGEDGPILPEELEEKPTHISSKEDPALSPDRQTAEERRLEELSLPQHRRKLRRG